MRRILITLGIVAGFSFAAASPASAATRNYDCSKPGNANKAACKTAAKPAAAAPVTRTSTVTTKATTTTKPTTQTTPTVSTSTTSTTK